MKKLFSILLTVAMLLSAVAFPAVVSAEGETVNLSFVVKKGNAVVGAENPVYPGDTITVDVMATANVAFDTNNANLYLTYDATKLTKVSFENLNETSSGYVSYVYSNAETALPITTEGTTLGTMTFTVNDTAVGSAIFAFAAETNIPVFLFGTGLVPSKAAFAVREETVAFAASSATPQIEKGGVFENIPPTGGNYFNQEGIKVKAVDIKGNVTVILSSEALEEDVDLLAVDDYTITDSGDYTITVTHRNGEAQVYTFKFAKYSVDATLSIAYDSEDDSYADGYVADETFNMPVTIDGLFQANASMVKFTVNYDEDVLELVAPADTDDLYSVSGSAGAKTIVYNDNADDDKNALGDGDVVATLNFKVLENAAYGMTTVSIVANEMALVTTAVDPTDYEIEAENSDVYAVIVPAEGTPFATVTDVQVGFTNAPYNVAVVPVTNAESKVYYSQDPIDTTNASSMFASGSAIVDGNFTVNASGYYYVVTMIGSVDKAAVYQVANAVKSKYDGIKPVIADIEDALTWTSTVVKEHTLPVTVTDEVGGSGVAKLEYKLSEDATYVESDSTEEIVLEVGTSAKKIWLKATDVAGNPSYEKVVVIMIDGAAPEATLAVGTQANGAVPFTITVRDDLSGIKSVVVMKDGEVAQDVTTVADYAYSATKSGTYTVVVTDNAGNETTSDAVEVKITAAVVLPIKVAIASGKATVEGGFTAGEGVNNGTFRYVKIEKLADEEGFTTTYELTTAPEGATLVFNEIVVDGVKTYVAEISDVAGAYTLTTTTKNNVDESDVKTAVYNFNIATSQATMKSVDEDAYFSIYDYALLVAKSASKEVDAAFTGGLLSADVNADMEITADDAADVITALREVKYVGIYNFAISGAHDNDAALN